jgi:hypothetical protein
VVGWANEARDRCQPAPLLKRLQAVGSWERPLILIKAFGPNSAMLFGAEPSARPLDSGGFLHSVFPITEAAKVRRPLLSTHSGPKPRALNEKPPLCWDQRRPVVRPVNLPDWAMRLRETGESHAEF